MPEISSEAFLKWAIERGQPVPPSKYDKAGRLVPLQNTRPLAVATFQTWVVSVPRQYGIEDLLDPTLWRNVELALQARAGRPRPGDLLRAIAEDGSFDAFFVIREVNRGYHLTFSHGRLPAQDLSS